VKRDLTKGPVLKVLIGMSIPIIITNLLQSAYQMTDTFWLGRLGAEAVAAVSLTFPVLFLGFSLAIGLSIAATVLIAQAMGRGDSERVDLLATQSYVFMGLIGIALSIVGSIFAGQLMSLIGAQGEVLALATNYLRISLVGVPFLFAFAIYQSVVRGVGDVRAPLFIVHATVLLNLVLDPLFIYGFGPVPALGVGGAAMASVVTQALSAMIGFVLLRTGSVRLRRAYLIPRLDIIRLLVRIGIPSSFDSGARAFSFIIMAGIVAALGTDAIAAYGIGQSILGFIIIPALGLSIGTTAMVGQTIGARMNDRAIRTIRVGVKIGFGVLSIVGLLIVLFAPSIIAFFVPGESEVIMLGTQFLRIIGFTFGLIGIQMVISGALRGAGRARAPLWITLINLYIIQLPLAWYLSAYTSFGPVGVWVAVAVANVFGALLALIWNVRTDWERIEAQV
jgi:putative MATE family efflux protein